MSVYCGQKITVTVFGQSHGPAIGAVVDGLPAGFRIDTEKLAAFMARRAPGQGAHTTARRETDRVEFSVRRYGRNLKRRAALRRHTEYGRPLLRLRSDQKHPAPGARGLYRPREITALPGTAPAAGSFRAGSPRRSALRAQSACSFWKRRVCASARISNASGISAMSGSIPRMSPPQISARLNYRPYHH